jgi:hypothetical protein
MIEKDTHSFSPQSTILIIHVSKTGSLTKINTVIFWKCNNRVRYNSCRILPTNSSVDGIPEEMAPTWHHPFHASIPRIFASPHFDGPNHGNLLLPPRDPGYNLPWSDLAACRGRWLSALPICAIRGVEWGDDVNHGHRRRRRPTVAYQQHAPTRHTSHGTTPTIVGGGKMDLMMTSKV